VPPPLGNVKRIFCLAYVYGQFTGKRSTLDKTKVIHLSIVMFEIANAKFIISCTRSKKRTEIWTIDVVVKKI